MKTRLKKWLPAEHPLPHIMTFHALAYAIVQPPVHLLSDDHHTDSLERSRHTQKVIDQLILNKGADYLRIRDIMLERFRHDWERIIRGRLFLPPKELIKYRSALPRETLSGERVKSYGEKLIANLLFEYDIVYEYERAVPWRDTIYRPDFTVFLQKSRTEPAVIIEYFGSTGDDYDAMSEEKRRFWANRPQRFLEYTPEDITKTDFEKQLLCDIGLRGRRKLSADEIWERVKGRAVSSFSRAMTNFIGRCRNADLTVRKLQNMIDRHQSMIPAEQKFLDAARSIYAGYLDRLQRENAGDFDGLMWHAIKCVRDGCTQFVRQKGQERGDLKQLRFVMIDEFQDFSRMFLELSKAIRRINSEVRFFGVGDDWQAINAFAGSELRFFGKFERYFKQNSRRLSVRTNYRSGSSIVNAGNALMHGWGAPALSGGTSSARVLAGDLDEFVPQGPFECWLHRKDEVVPAVLRLVQGFLKSGTEKRVALLSRTHYLPWRTGTPRLKDLRDLVHEYLSNEDRARVDCETVHGYKGREASAVIVLDACARRYPLIHADWVFNRVLGDKIDRLVEDERRLLYVGITRAVEALVLLSRGRSTRHAQPFLFDVADGDLGLTKLKWGEQRQTEWADGEFEEIRVDNHKRIDDTRALLRESGFAWNPETRDWRLIRRTPTRPDGDVVEVLKQWTGLEVTVTPL